MHKMTRKRLTVAIPASIISDTPHLREKTSKIGFIGRAAAIFNVNEIIVYADNPKFNQKKDLDLITLFLNYMETPQYLRKRLFELKPELQYAGILPPLRTPHHPLTGKVRDLKVGQFREGITVSKGKNGLLIDIGAEQPAVLNNTQIPLNKRITVKISNLSGQVEVQLANPEEVPEYWGYVVSVEKNLGNIIENPKFDLAIGTSKLAPGFQDVIIRLAERWQKAKSVLVLFGAPARGLHEIARDEGKNLNNILDFVVNTLPNQGTETVRTEEAFLASLAIFNVQLAY
jgi:predicted SPOUT superfamily RNA methylase MTH1